MIRCGAAIKRPLENLQTSQHYGVEGLKGVEAQLSTQWAERGHGEFIPSLQNKTRRTSIVVYHVSEKLPDLWHKKKEHLYWERLTVYRYTIFFSESCWIKLSLDCNYTFLIDIGTKWNILWCQINPKRVIFLRLVIPKLS